MNKKDLYVLKILIKNILLEQYYNLFKSIDNYFNRKLPFILKMIIAMFIQMNGAILLTIVAISVTNIIDEKIVLLFFSFIALFSTYFQSKRDCKTFDILYERLIFSFNYNNKKTLIINALSYCIANIVKNPMVYIPYIVYPIFLRLNPITCLVLVLCIPLIYLDTFFKSNNNLWISKKQIYKNIIEIEYLVRNIITGVAVYIFFYYIVENVGMASVNDILEKFKEDLGSIFNMRLLNKIGDLCIYYGYYPIFIIGLLIFIKELHITKEVRFHRFKERENKNILKTLYINLIKNFTKDIKVKSDLIIVSRKMNLWSGTPLISLLIPNFLVVVLSFLLLLIRISSIESNCFMMIIFSAFVCELFCAKYISNQFSFIMYHNSEMRNIVLYRMRNKQGLWLFKRKIKLLMLFMIIPSTVMMMLFFIVCLYYRRYITFLVLLILEPLFILFSAYLCLYWMFTYRVSYNCYEDFGSKRIDTSMYDNFKSVPILLLLIPYFICYFNIIYNKILFSNKVILLIGAIILSTILLFSIIVLRKSIKAYGRKFSD